MGVVYFVGAVARSDWFLKQKKVSREQCHRLCVAMGQSKSPTGACVKKTWEKGKFSLLFMTDEKKICT